jgi:pimeloyl-ACP methyl ester carboxylesterase
MSGEPPVNHVPDPIPDPILSRAQVPPINGRPVRKDEIELHDRGIYIESWLPERRSRRKPLLFVHGELTGSWLWERYLGYFAGRGWEGHALNLRNHHWSTTADPAELSFDTYVEDVVAALDRLGPTTVVIGHGMGGLLAMKAAERVAIGGLVLISAEPPRDLRAPARAYELREIPEVYGRSVIGWETLPEKLLRDERDLNLADVLRIQHLLGQKPHEAGAARRQVLAGVPVDRRVFAEVPRLVIGGGLDHAVPAEVSERLAEWLGAEYEPFGAHSHYGLVVGEQSYQQVAESVRAFLETNRL